MASNGEAIVQQTVARWFPDPLVVVDVGAHFGEWSIAMRRALGGRRAEFFGFEPSSYTFAKLADAVGAWATLERLGVSDQSGTAILNVVHPGAGSNSLVRFSDVRPTHPEEVRITRLDDYFDADTAPRISLLKVDAEGMDLSVLRGASRLLSHGQVAALQFEYNWRWADSRVLLADAFDLLTPLGYRLGKVTPKGIEFYKRWHYELETFAEANFVACQESLADLFPSIQWWNS
jgi:FkbM family methyltransferase